MNNTENTTQNQEQAFKQFKIDLAGLIANDELDPEYANILFKYYGKRLAKEEPKLYGRLSGIALSYHVMKAIKIRLAQNKVPIECLKVVLKYYRAGTKRFDPELYEQLKEKEKALRGIANDC